MLDDVRLAAPHMFLYICLRRLLIHIELRRHNLIICFAMGLIRVCEGHGLQVVGFTSPGLLRGAPL